MGWLHANDKPVIIGLLNHSKPYLVGLSLEEMADMPSCNLLETAHNKWMQQSGNGGNDLFAATCDDKIRAVM
jgi:hypothetical protein